MENVLLTDQGKKNMKRQFYKPKALFCCQAIICCKFNHFY